MNLAPTPVGLLVVDKEPGFTSMDVCAIIRGRLRRGGAPKGIKVGHGGTLDPLATGVLVVLVGKATKRCDEIMAGEKEYLADIDLAHRSTTDDAEGERTEVLPPEPPTIDQVRARASLLTGRIMQIPPAFSAVKVDGRRAYAQARKGRDVVIEPRPVDVHEFAILDFLWPLARTRVRCGKGTYVRSLARDLGSGLGCGGMLTSLRRTRVGPFGIEQARRLGEIPNALAQADLLPA